MVTSDHVKTFASLTGDDTYAGTMEKRRRRPGR
jgi:hypothetical protein